MEARDAELRALKAQINPHFLFNSLNTIADLIVREMEQAGFADDPTRALAIDAQSRSTSQQVAPGEAVARLRPEVVFTMLPGALPFTLLREVLEFSGHQVAVAPNGPEGIEMARVLKPDVVVCDIGLPEMDGYAVARAMRADPDLAHVALVALTGYATPEDRAKAREAGFDAHLAKPPNVEALEGAMAAAGC